MVRCRVMPLCFLVLLRFWMRVDNVIIRVRDTRIYHEFGWDYVLRIYEERQMRWEEFKDLGMSTDCADYIDPNVFSRNLNKRKTEKVKLFI